MKNTMKIPAPRKLPSGNWFIQLRLGGESIPITETTDKKCLATARLIKSEYLAGRRVKQTDITLKQAIDKYIESRSNTLSPSTLRGYYAIRNLRFKDVMEIPLDKINDWQSICNSEASKCSPKSLKNAWFFVASVLRYSDIHVPRIILPPVVKKERPYLEPEQIPLFIEAIKGTPCEIPALLALHSLRSSEICALTWNNIDLKNMRILVSGAAVYGENHKLILKDSNKNYSSQRYIPIMIDNLREALENNENKNGLVIKDTPKMIYEHINKVCAENGFPKVGIHGLRHSFASLAYHLGVPEKIAMQIGGWKDHETMRKIYIHLSQKDVDKYGNEIKNFYTNANKNANKN